MENNNDILKKLTDRIEQSKEEKEIIDIDLMYGIFLANNEFIICEEQKSGYRNEVCLQEFFTKETVAFNEFILAKTIYPWQEVGTHYFYNLSKVGYSVPLKDLLGKVEITETDILNLYKNVNKYIKKHPNFIGKLFNSEEEKVR